MGLAARAQQSGGPCDPATFNAGVCKTAIRQRGYCSGSTWVPNQYGQSYPYYYDLYQQHLAQGGLVSPAGACPSTLRPHHAMFGGFGHTGTFHAAHS